MRQILLYIIIGLAVLGTIFVLAVYVPNITHTWFNFVGFSFILAVVLTRMYWPVRKSLRVWLLLVAFMLVHCICYVALLRRVENWPGFLYIITCPIEIMLFAVIAKLWLNILPPTVRL